MAVKNVLTEENFKALDEFIDSMPTTKGELIRVLHKAQGIFGYLPAEVQKFVGKKLGIPVAKVYGVVSFYSYFTMTPKGDHNIAICLGTACYVRGAEKIVDAIKKDLNISIGETTPDGKFSIEVLRCVGACGLAPVVMVGEKVYGRVTEDMVTTILAEYK